MEPARIARTAAALGLAAVLAACSGSSGEGAGSPTPSVAPGWTGTTGTTGATGSTGSTGATPQPTEAQSPSPASIVQGSFDTSFQAGDATIRLTGYTCDVARGDWVAEATASGDGSGGGSFTFSIPAGQDGTRLSWSFAGRFGGKSATYETEGEVTKGGPADAPKLQFFGLLTVSVGKQELRGPANATADVVLGPVAACA